jgi:Fe-S cluster assembly ATPase SufC
MGFKEVRLKINKGDVEGAISFGRELVKNLERNHLALQSVGMPLQMPAELATLVQEIFDLNADQNSKMSDRGETSDGNMAVYNEFWEIISTILVTAKALYRGVDEVKLKNYTMTQLIKRVNATGENKKTPDVPDAPKA